MTEETEGPAQDSEEIERLRETLEYPDDIALLVRPAAAAEREACAVMCDSWAKTSSHMSDIAVLERVAAGLRALEPDNDDD